MASTRGKFPKMFKIVFIVSSCQIAFRLVY